MNTNVLISGNFGGLSASSVSDFGTNDSVTVNPGDFARKYYQGLMTFVRLVTCFLANPDFGFHTIVLNDDVSEKTVLREIQDFADRESLISVSLKNAPCLKNSQNHERPDSESIGAMFIFGRKTKTVLSEKDLRTVTENFLKRLNISTWHFSAFSGTGELSRIRIDECLRKALAKQPGSVSDTRFVFFTGGTAYELIAEKIAAELSIFGRWQPKSGICGKNASKKIIPDINKDTFILRNNRQEIITAYEKIMKTPGIKESLGYSPVTLDGTAPLLYQEIVSHDHEYGDFSVYLRNHPKPVRAFAMARAKAVAAYVTGSPDIDGKEAVISLARGHFRGAAVLRTEPENVQELMKLAVKTGLLSPDKRRDSLLPDIRLEFNHACRYQDFFKNPDFRLKTGIPDPSYVTGLTEKLLPEFTSLHAFFLIVTAIAERSGIREFNFMFSTPINHGKPVCARYVKKKTRNASVNEDSDTEDFVQDTPETAVISPAAKNVAFKPARIVIRRCSFFNSCSALDFTDVYELTAVG